VLFAKLESKGDGAASEQAAEKKMEAAPAEGKKIEKAEAGKAEGEEEEKPASNLSGIGIGSYWCLQDFWHLFVHVLNNLSKRPIIPENDPYLKK